MSSVSAIALCCAPIAASNAVFSVRRASRGINAIDEIATELKNQQNIEIDKKKILLKDSIKETGVFNIEIKLYEGIIGKLKIDIVG